MTANERSPLADIEIMNDATPNHENTNFNSDTDHPKVKDFEQKNLDRLEALKNKKL